MLKYYLMCVVGKLIIIFKYIIDVRYSILTIRTTTLHIPIT